MLDCHQMMNDILHSRMIQNMVSVFFIIIFLKFVSKKYNIFLNDISFFSACKIYFSLFFFFIIFRIFCLKITDAGAETSETVRTAEIKICKVMEEVEEWVLDLRGPLGSPTMQLVNVKGDVHPMQAVRSSHMLMRLCRPILETFSPLCFHFLIIFIIHEVP